MPRRALLVSFVLLVIPSVVTAQEPKKPAPFRFDWPVPGKVTVTELAEARGKSFKIRYRLKITRAEDSKDIRVHYHGYEFLEYEGKPISDEMRRHLEPTLAMISIMPDLRISKDGESLDVFDIDAFIDKSYEMIFEIRKKYGVKTDPEKEKSMLAAMKTPMMKAAMKARILDTWETWVGNWVGLDLQPDEMLEGTVEEPIPLGTTPVSHDLVIINHGEAEGYPGMVRLTAEISVGGEKDSKTVIEDMIEFFKKTPGGAPDSHEIESIESLSKAEVITDPKTLKPRKAMWQKKVSVVGKAEGTKSSIERHTYTFEW